MNTPNFWAILGNASTVTAQSRVPVATVSQVRLVVMDNLSAHKVEGVRQRIEAAGAQLLYTALLARLQPDRTSLVENQAPSAFGQIADGRRAGGDHSAGPPNDHGTKRLAVVFPLRIRSTLIVKML